MRQLLQVRWYGWLLVLALVKMCVVQDGYAQQGEDSSPVGPAGPAESTEADAAAPSGEGTLPELQAPDVSAPLAAESAPRDFSTPIHGPRELFDALRVDDSHFRALIDGRPIHESDRETLMRVLLRLPEFPLARVESWTQTDIPLKALLENPSDYRGQIFALQGRVNLVSVEQPLPEVADRFNISEYYRCKAISADGEPLVIYTRDVPSAWQIGQPIDREFSAKAFFLKTGQQQDSRTELIFAAQSIAWHPDTVLGGLGMDYGLFDVVRNGKPMTDVESEAFYQMLLAVSRSGANELQRRVAADQSLVPMLLKPDGQHGELALISGTARSAVKVLINDAEMVSRLGFDHYYQVVVFVDVGQPVVMNDTRFNNYPFTVCVLKLPAGMPTGEKINEQVSVPAFFYKLWTYRSQLAAQTGEAERQPSPLLIGKQLQWAPAETSARSNYFGLMVGGLFIVTLLGMWIGAWRLNRGDKEFHERTIAPLHSPEQGRSLNDVGLESRDKPDFTNL